MARYSKNHSSYHSNPLQMSVYPSWSILYCFLFRQMNRSVSLSKGSLSPPGNTYHLASRDFMTQPWRDNKEAMLIRRIWQISLIIGASHCSTSSKKCQREKEAINSLPAMSEATDVVFILEFYSPLFSIWLESELATICLKISKVSLECYVQGYL